MREHGQTGIELSSAVPSDFPCSLHCNNFVILCKYLQLAFTEEVGKGPEGRNGMHFM